MLSELIFLMPEQAQSPEHLKQQSIQSKQGCIMDRVTLSFSFRLKPVKIVLQKLSLRVRARLYAYSTNPSLHVRCYLVRLNANGALSYIYFILLEVVPTDSVLLFQPLFSQNKPRVKRLQIRDAPIIPPNQRVMSEQTVNDCISNQSKYRGRGFPEYGWTNE